MPPKREISIKIDVSGGTLVLNGSAVTTVYDTRSCAWFKSNDVASALGYVNASSSVSQMISPGDRSAFKDINLHKDSSMVDSNGRNIFLNQKGLIEFLSARDPSCDVAKIRSIGQPVKNSANSRLQDVGSSYDVIPQYIVGAQKPTGICPYQALTSDRNSGGWNGDSTISIDVRGKTLFLNGIAIDTIYDMRSNAWFKSNDVANALGYSNASSSVSKRISANDKMAFGDISLHRDSPHVPAHPRNIFLSQSGLMSYLLDLYPSCAALKIQSIGQSLKNNQAHAIASQHHSTIIPSQRQNTNIPSCRLFINQQPITLIVDVNKNAWFKVNDIGAALGFSNASNSISHVSEKDKSPLKDVAIHQDSPAVNADLRNIFINQRGLMDVLHAKRRQAQETHISTCFAEDNPANLNACDKLVLKAIYSCFKDFNKLSHNLTPNNPSYKTDFSFPKSPGMKIFARSSNNLTRPQPCDSSSPSSRSQSYHTANSHPYDCNGYWDEEYINLKMIGDSVEFEITKSPNSGSTESIKVHSAPKLLKLIKHFLPDLNNTNPCNFPFKQLASVVSKICSNFEKTLHIVCKITSTVNSSSQSSTTPQPMSKDDIGSMTGLFNSPGEWIYIASSIPYALRNVFKVGSTEDRLVKRLSHYQTGRLNEDRFHYFKVFPVHNCKEVDKLISFFLRPWAQTNEKITEVYTLDFRTLSSLVSEIINHYENSYECVMSLNLD